MEFFDKKEEVLEVKLTSYGKHLYSQGNLKPVYYAFLDNDILYDTSAADFIETQNSAERRIKFETPSLKTITTRTGAETRVGTFQQAVSSVLQNSDPANNVELFNQQQPYADQQELNTYILGNSSLATEYAPAWEATILSEPELGPVQEFINESGFTQKIPQLNIEIDYETYYDDSSGLTSNALTSYLGDSGIFLAMKENYLLLEIREENTLFEKENFDIEVFHSGAAAPAAAGVYTPLAHADTEGSTIVSPLPINNASNGVGNVEYYMNVLVDGDIPVEVYESWGITDQAFRSSGRRLNLNRNLYETDNEEPC